MERATDPPGRNEKSAPTKCPSHPAPQVLDETQTSPATRFLWSVLLKVLDLRKMADCASMVLINLLLRDLGLQLVDWAASEAHRLDRPAAFVTETLLGGVWRLFGIRLEPAICRVFGDTEDSDPSLPAATTTVSRPPRTPAEALAVQDLSLLFRSIALSCLDYYINLWNCCFTAVQCWREVLGLDTITDTVTLGEDDPFAAPSTFSAAVLFSVHTTMGDQWLLGGLVHGAQITQQRFMVASGNVYQQIIPAGARNWVKRTRRRWGGWGKEKTIKFGKSLTKEMVGALEALGVVDEEESVERVEIGRFLLLGGLEGGQSSLR